MSNYLIELAVIHIALILGYWFLLRKERQYTKMRFYLVGSTLMALTVPLLELPKLSLSGKEPTDAGPVEAISLDAMVPTPAADISTWNDDLLIWIYITISGLLLLKFFSSVLYIIYLARKSSYENFNGLNIRKVRNIKGSFTFFNWIFLSDEIDKNQQDYDVILKHEKAHGSLGHTHDLMFFEFFKICFWWLPTAWYIIKEIKTIHEYQADAYALKSCSVDHYSSILINSTLKSNGLSLASSFHDGLILKRLIAMKQQVKNVSPWKLGVLSALCASLIMVFACTEQEKDRTNPDLSDQSKMEGDAFTPVEEQPEFDGGMVAFNRYVGKEMNYPLQARQTGVEGRVDVSFVVEKDGSLSDVKVSKGIGAGCDREAERVIQNAPSFKPGTQRGKPVRVRMVMPIIFKLNEGETNEGNSTKGIIFAEEAEQKNSKLKVDASYANGEWSGTVYDEEGEELPGANIVVAGTTTGTSSDIDGTFKVKANQSKELYISFAGYERVRLEGK
jgi:TonB family protein